MGSDTQITDPSSLISTPREGKSDGCMIDANTYAPTTTWLSNSCGVNRAQPAKSIESASATGSLGIRACRITERPLTCGDRRRGPFEKIKILRQIDSSRALPGREGAEFARRRPIEPRQTPRQVQGLVMRRNAASLQAPPSAINDFARGAIGMSFLSQARNEKLSISSPEALAISNRQAQTEVGSPQFILGKTSELPALVPRQEGQSVGHSVVASGRPIVGTELPFLESVARIAFSLSACE